MAMKRSSLTQLFIMSGVAGLALNAQAQQMLDMQNKAPTAPRTESRVLIRDFNKITGNGNDVQISEYSALIETQDRKLMVCAGLKVEDYSLLGNKPVDKVHILVTSPQVADLLRPAPEENANAQDGGVAQGKKRSYGSCMPYRVHFPDNILSALRNGDPGPMMRYMGQAADWTGIAAVDGKDGVLASRWVNVMTDPSKRLPDFELPEPVEPPEFNDSGKQRDYIGALQDQPPYDIGNMASCPNTGFNKELADSIGNWATRTTAPIQPRGCSPI